MKAFDRIFGEASAYTHAQSLPGYEAAPGRYGDHGLFIATVNRVRTAGVRLGALGAVVASVVTAATAFQHPSQTVADPLMVGMLNVMLIVGPALAVGFAAMIATTLVEERLRIAALRDGVIVKSVRPRLF